MYQTFYNTIKNCKLIGQLEIVNAYKNHTDVQNVEFPEAGREVWRAEHRSKNF